MRAADDPHDPGAGDPGAATTPPGAAAALAFARPPVAVLDANVVFTPFHRELLLHLSGRGLFADHWTPRIADEAARNMVRRSEERHAADPTRKVLPWSEARRIFELMNAHRPGALLPDPGPAAEALFPHTDPKDRHVAAAARAARLALGFHGTPASAPVRLRRRERPVPPPRVGVVTWNVGDFAPEDFAAHDLFVATPDAFLVALARWGGRLVLAGLAAHAAGLSRPPLDSEQYLAECRRLRLEETAAALGGPLRLIMPAARKAAADAVRQAAEAAGGRPLTAAERQAARQAVFDGAYQAALDAAELAGIE